MTGRHTRGAAHRFSRSPYFRGKPFISGEALIRPGLDHSSSTIGPSRAERTGYLFRGGLGRMGCRPSTEQHPPQNGLAKKSATGCLSFCECQRSHGKTMAYPQMCDLYRGSRKWGRGPCARRKKTSLLPSYTPLKESNHSHLSTKTKPHAFRLSRTEYGRSDSFDDLIQGPCLTSGFRFTVCRSCVESRVHTTRGHPSHQLGNQPSE